MITLSLIYFGFVGALYGMQFWLPQIVKAFGFTNAQTGFVTAIPYLFGTIAMILWARHSDATRERVAHVGGAAAADGGGARRLQLHGQSLCHHGRADRRRDRHLLHFRRVLDAADAWLSGTAAAGAIALINSIGNLAGFGGPYLIGWVKEATGSTSTGTPGARCCR